MTIQIVRFNPVHLDGFDLQDAQAWMQQSIQDPAYTKTLADCKHCFTAIADGVPMFCGGVMEIWPGRGLAWALVHKQAGQHMHAIVRSVRGFMQCTEFTRIEALVDDDFKQGVQLMRLLGFKQEAVMQSFNPNGSDCRLFSRVKPCQPS